MLYRYIKIQNKQKTKFENKNKKEILKMIKKYTFILCMFVYIHFNFLYLQIDDNTISTSDDETSSKRSVRFTEETKEREACEGESQSDSDLRQPIDYVSHTMKRHSSIFHNALRPNSALRQLFPSTIQSSAASGPITQEALKALDENKLGLSDGMLSDSDTDTIKKTIERNVLRRSLIKYEPKYVLNFS